MTLDQQKTTTVLNGLHFTFISNPDAAPGSSPVFSITDETIKQLTNKIGSRFEVTPNGEISWLERAGELPVRPR